MTIASLWKTLSVNPSQRRQNHQVSAPLSLGRVQHGPSAHRASQSLVMEPDGTARAGGERAVLPLCPSAAAPCVSERRDYSGEVTGSFDEPISHPSPPARKHLESCSVTFPPARLADSLLATTVRIPRRLWPFGPSLVSSLGSEARQERSHVPP